MSVTLRLSRTGSKNRPSFRIVATETARPRDGRFLEILGHYNSRTTPPLLHMNEERVRYWIGMGAMTSGMLHTLIKRSMPGFIEEIEKRRVSRVQAQRKARKARAAKRGPAKAKPAKEKKIAKKKAAPKKAKAE